jgi:hypothetical protein
MGTGGGAQPGHELAQVGERRLGQVEHGVQAHLEGVAALPVEVVGGQRRRSSVGGQRAEVRTDQVLQLVGDAAAFPGRRQASRLGERTGGLGGDRGAAFRVVTVHCPHASRCTSAGRAP